MQKSIQLTYSRDSPHPLNILIVQGTQRLHGFRGVENVFALPGIGNLMISAIFNRDFPVVQGVTLVFAVLVVAVTADPT